jgi:disulfide bond formation protein DsbB
MPNDSTKCQERLPAKKEDMMQNEPKGCLQDKWKIVSEQNWFFDHSHGSANCNCTSQCHQANNCRLLGIAVLFWCSFVFLARASLRTGIATQSSVA